MDLSELVEISRFYGRGTDFAIAGGGNTSVKDGETLVIKASGAGLKDITEAGFVSLSRAAVREILSRTYGKDPFQREAQIKADLLASRTDPAAGGRPSVETSLHEMIGWRYVVHTHPYAVNALTCARDGEAAARELFGGEALWVPYSDPGYKLAKLMQEKLAAYRSAHKGDPRIVLMRNHGLLVAADSTAEIRQLTDGVLEKISARFRRPVPREDRPVPDAAVRVVPGLRMLLSDAESAKVAAVRNSALVEHFLLAENRAGVSLPFMPDNIVYCKSAPLVLELGDDPEKLLSGFPAARAAYRERWGYDPKIILIDGLGMVAVEDSKRSAETCLDVFEDYMKVSFLSEAFGGPSFLGAADIQFIDTWEVESYRRSVAKGAASRKRMEGKIALITGAAQGFGKGIAEGLFAEGANIVIADLNETAGRALEDQLNASAVAAGSTQRSIFAAVDVTSPASLQALARECVKAFGGLDVLVSNAGVLKAGGLEEMTPESFDFVTRVNYTGYFLCVKYLSPIMKLQRRFSVEGRATDIIQINSKSGLEGSNRNFAYAGGKFGGVGLTQSFALELVENGIKVNSICPGNFFEGPLWSDPEKGLFVQYLRAGKVPGAKTVEDVRRSYESRVPMGRGCRVEDVVKAILYLVDQQYETGQALPVTGGQVMLG
jgi:NAD(P)-dependent dehydrogenase (short-subunit alcohol dehydrogenase family)/rhamnose utilization protein RhaD (predicted bifunctional aldolase and dehydrogenase)